MLREGFGFEDEPLQFDDYVLKSTGQNCHEISKFSSPNYLECTYYNSPPYVPVFPSGGELHTSDILQVDELNSCGWAFEKISISKLQNPGEDPTFEAPSSRHALTKFYENLKKWETNSTLLSVLNKIIDSNKEE